MSELTVTQQRRLKVLEQEIATGAADIYRSLRAIHDEKLYRGQHGTFEDYCRERWQMSARHAQNLLKHGQILRVMEASADPKIGTIVPKIKEAHTREVADLPPEQAAAIVTETVESTGGKPTAKAVRDTRAARERPPSRSPGRGDSKPPRDEFAVQRSKTVKTAEALQRAFEDLNDIRKSGHCKAAVAACGELIQTAKNWQ